MVRMGKEDPINFPSRINFFKLRNLSAEIMREYTGLDLLDMNKHPHPQQPYHYYKLFVQCTIISGQARNGLDTKGVKFYHEDHLPKLSLEGNTDTQINMNF